MAVGQSNTLAIGTALREFSLPDVDGRALSISDFKDAPALLLTFTCNHCPYAKAAWPILIDLQKRFGPQGLQIVAINPNNNPEYPEDAFERMKPYAASIGLNFPYLFDGDQAVARLYGAVCTPDNYLFASGKLVYHGRINDNWQQPEAVKERSLELFVRSALGEQLKTPERTYPSMGCSIKWI